MSSASSNITPKFRSLCLTDLHTPPRTPTRGTPNNISSLIGLGQGSSTPTTPTTPTNRKYEERKVPMGEDTPTKRANAAAARTLPSPRGSPAQMTNNAINGMSAPAAQPAQVQPQANGVVTQVAPAPSQPQPPVQLEEPVFAYGRVRLPSPMEEETPPGTPPQIERRGDSIQELLEPDSPEEMSLEPTFTSPAPHPQYPVPPAPARLPGHGGNGMGGLMPRRLF